MQGLMDVGRMGCSSGNGGEAIPYVRLGITRFRVVNIFLPRRGGHMPPSSDTLTLGGTHLECGQKKSRKNAIYDIYEGGGAIPYVRLGITSFRVVNIFVPRGGGLIPPSPDTLTLEGTHLECGQKNSGDIAEISNFVEWTWSCIVCIDKNR
jgi:hypothetical protein